METATQDKEALGKALGRITSGLYVITTGTGDQKQGLLASWVMQAGFDPPALTVIIQKDREILHVPFDFFALHGSGPQDCASLL